MLSRAGLISNDQLDSLILNSVVRTVYCDFVETESSMSNLLECNAQLEKKNSELNASMIQQSVRLATQDQEISNVKRVAKIIIEGLQELRIDVESQNKSLQDILNERIERLSSQNRSLREQGRERPHRTETTSLESDMEGINGAYQQLKLSVQNHRLRQDGLNNDQDVMLAGLRADKREQMEQYRQRVSALEDRQRRYAQRAEMLLIVGFMTAFLLACFMRDLERRGII